MKGTKRAENVEKAPVFCPKKLRAKLLAKGNFADLQISLLCSFIFVTGIFHGTLTTDKYKSQDSVE